MYGSDALRGDCVVPRGVLLVVLEVRLVCAALRTEETVLLEYQDA